MGCKTLTIAGVEVVLRNIAGSAITRVTIAGVDAFGFDPERRSFVDFVNGQRRVVAPDLPLDLKRALLEALSKHSDERRGSPAVLDRTIRRTAAASEVRAGLSVTRSIDVAKDTEPVVLSPPATDLTVFEVGEGGTLRMAGYAEAGTRAEFYEDVSGDWARSPQDLVDAMEQCQPLAWEVHSIYSDFRSELEEDVLAAQRAGRGNKRRLTALKARLRALPEEPDEGSTRWLLGLASGEFESRIVPKIAKWFGEEPDWSFEDDYLPETSTAQGAALAYFRDMAVGDRITLGVKVIEGEHPGSTYYAAELRGDIACANRAAEAGQIPVRFVAATD